MQFNIWPTFPDYFGCRYLSILDQTSRLKQSFEEKTKFKLILGRSDKSTSVMPRIPGDMKR